MSKNKKPLAHSIKEYLAAYNTYHFTRAKCTPEGKIYRFHEGKWMPEKEFKKDNPLLIIETFSRKKENPDGRNKYRN